MNNSQKFLKKLNQPLKGRVYNALAAIINNELASLDIKALIGTKNIYRCRISKIRIIFKMASDGNHIIGIGFRGDIY